MSAPNINQLFQQARQHFSAGQFVKAVALCDELQQIQPGQTPVLNLKAMTHLGLGQPETAAKTMSLALRSSKPEPGLLLNAARIDLDCCNYAGARAHLAAAIDAGPREPGLLQRAAVLLRDARDSDAALRIAEQCCQLAAQSAEAHWLMGSILIDQGQTEAARAALSKAVGLQPGHARALSDWARIREAKDDARLLALLRQCATRHPVARDRATAAFALGMIHHQAEDSERAFKWFTRANSLLPRNEKQVTAWQAKLTHLTKALANPQAPVAAPPGTEGCRLVFIVGLPRSGTSLCEQIISAHPAAVAAGELPTMHYLDARFARRGQGPWTAGHLAKPSLRKAAEHYLRSLPGGAQEARVVTDKAPLNFLRLGLINQMFPDALFIHCQRHPMDTLLSIWFQDFHRGLPWSRDLQDIADTVIAEAQIMQLWRANLGDRILDFSYAQAVQSLPDAVAQLTSFLGLKTDSAMLRPEAQQSTVTTASNVQVREPVHERSLGYWTRYRDLLPGPLQRIRQAGLPV